MEARQVVRTEKQVMWPGGLHPHVAALILENGCRIEAADAILRLDIRTAAYTVIVDGRPADVAVERCERCELDHLYTVRDTTLHQHLLALPEPQGLAES